MADYDLSVSRSVIPELFEQPTGLARLVEMILNQLLEAQMSEHLGAARHERSDERDGYRNGYRDRPLATRIGPLTLRVPQTRDGSFSTEIFERYRRSEQAFVVGLMEMVVNGVSTRKVTKITEGLCRTAFSKSTVSRLTKALDIPVSAFFWGDERDKIDDDLTMVIGRAGHSEDRSIPILEFGALSRFPC